MQTFDMLINGENVHSDSYFNVINPATGHAFASCQQGNSSHVDQAVKAARQAFPSWSQCPDEERTAMIHALADAVEANMPELMTLVTKETGKPMAGLNYVGSGMEIGGSIAWIRATAALSTSIDVAQENQDARIEIHRKPLGVVGSILPWNWPLMIAIWHVIPALKAGNTVVMKPSDLTPAATVRFAQLANDILPAGVLNVVTGGGDVGEAISTHSGINKIVFTGSTATGKQVMQNAAGTLKRLTLELGGNDAGIVLPDIDIEKTLPKLFGACFHNNGQTCAALKRLYVHESIYEQVCTGIAALAKSVKVGNGLEQETELGPIQNAAQLAIVTELAEHAKANGGRILAGGNKIVGEGYFFEPTIVADLTNGDRLVDEEPFGPIVPIIKYDTIEEAIKLANDSNSGLGGSVWSKDIAKASEIALQFETGSVWINDHGALQPNVPFGGVKQSGFGVEFAQYGLEEYTSLQAVRIPK